MGFFAASDYLSALQALLPRGRVWSREPDSVQTRVLAGFAPTFARLDAAAADLLVDAFPATAVDLLPEWEASVGLPDPCAGLAPTIPLREAQVVARLQGFGGQSVGFFTSFAALLGFAITIQEYTGANHDKWQVTVPGSNISYFLADDAYAEDPVDQVATNAQVLQCEFARLKPAHTLLIWNFI